MNTIRLNRSYAAILVLFVAGIVSYFYFNSYITFPPAEQPLVLMQVFREMGGYKVSDFADYKEIDSGDVYYLPSILIEDNRRTNYYYGDDGTTEKTIDFEYKNGKWIPLSQREYFYDDSNRVKEILYKPYGNYVDFYFNLLLDLPENAKVDYRLKKITYTDFGGENYSLSYRVNGKWLELDRDYTIWDKQFRKKYSYSDAKKNGKWERTFWCETEYDKYGREIKEKDERGTRIIRYDLKGNKISDSSENWKTTYVYNKQDKLQSELIYSSKWDDRKEWQWYETITYKYDRHSNLTCTITNKGNYKEIKDYFYNDRGEVLKTITKTYRENGLSWIDLKFFHPKTQEEIIHCMAKVKNDEVLCIFMQKSTFSKFGKLIEKKEYEKGKDEEMQVKKTAVLNYDENFNLVSGNIVIADSSRLSPFPVLMRMSLSLEEDKPISFNWKNHILVKYKKFKRNLK